MDSSGTHVEHDVLLLDHLLDQGGERGLQVFGSQLSPTMALIPGRVERGEEIGNLLVVCQHHLKYHSFCGKQITDGTQALQFFQEGELYS